ncbi:cobyric acid synthase [Staphylospora marina]|uniref:cobyric acid synthase n=1 Tax=Staphylospora marina TaxID=2490858 RepID=UPI001F15091B|nr:cobyric acid synthase [Staphylospora marina]
MTRAIMLQGTASDVGKSLLCTAFCRWFHEEGYRVAPFKSQNMALNSWITPDGGEIGRAQAVQAEAAGTRATVEMNPILLKPKREAVTEVVLLGKHFAELEAGRYREKGFETGLKVIRESLERLSSRFDVLVIEGAGSPAEINLKYRDLANMKVAELADAPVILVADIDRGGAFASVVGTLELLEPEERRRVKGVIINKFRGIRDLLEPGIRWLEERTGIPVLGVMPHLDVGLDPEDSLALESLRLKPATDRPCADVAVIGLPYLSHFTDLLPLAHAPDVRLRLVKSPADIGRPDVVVLPGTENPTEDLAWIRKLGWDKRIRSLHEEGVEVVGIGGGFHLLGQTFSVPSGPDSRPLTCPGLALLPVDTADEGNRQTARRSGVSRLPWAKGVTVGGYGRNPARIMSDSGILPAFEWNDKEAEGAVAEDGSVWGTTLHGLFDNPAFTHRWIDRLRLKRGMSPRPPEWETFAVSREKLYDRLSRALREHVDMQKVLEIMGLSKK